MPKALIAEVTRPPLPPPLRLGSYAPVSPFVWLLSETRELANARCALCLGLGLVDCWIDWVRHARPCECVLRTIFQACHLRYLKCGLTEGYRGISHVRISGQGRTYSFQRISEDYLADFYLVSKRTLSGLDWHLFRLHFAAGQDWRTCCETLGIDREAFFRAVDRVEQKLGRAFRELAPYPLFPVDEYFGLRKARKQAGERLLNAR